MGLSRLVGWAGLGISALVVSAFHRRPAGQAAGPVTRDTLERWMSRVSNAGRWGAGDEIGTLNFITPARRREAARLVREGTSISLAHELVPGPNPRAVAPLSLRYLSFPADSLVTWGLDSTTVLFHGWAYSHIDALSHTSWRGRMYNNVGIDAFHPTGTRRLGIQTMGGAGIVTRGFLFDIPRLRGTGYLDPGTLIMPADLDRWERLHGIRVGPGDVVLIRTGRWAREAVHGSWDVTRGAAGPHPSVAVWLHGRSAAALGGDVSSEYYPSVVPGVSDPLHQIALVAMGMPLMDNLDLEAVAEAAARAKRWTFLFMAAPLRVRGGSGSLLNPIAVF
jgi:kynurenine formamidase